MAIPTLIINTTVTSKKTLRTKVEPPRMASREPIIAPVILAKPIMMPICQITAPFIQKTIKAPIFVATFTTLAMADAVINAYPKVATSISIKNDPVPGPKIPS